MWILEPADTCAQAVTPAGAVTATGIKESIKEFMPSWPLLLEPAWCKADAVSGAQQARLPQPKGVHDCARVRPVPPSQHIRPRLCCHSRPRIPTMAL